MLGQLRLWQPVRRIHRQLGDGKTAHALDMKHTPLFLTVLWAALSSFSGNALAQTREVEELWFNQLDTSKIDYRKPEYLQINESQLLQLFDRQPNFGMYKDNYFISGIPINQSINKHTADAKFQISIRQRLTKTILPFNTSLMLTYTQKSFWNIYKKSSPFEDNNYNPGLALIRPILHQNRLQGSAVLAIEHESNGKDSLDSRGWNYLTLTGVYFFNANFTFQAKIWAGFLDRGETDGAGDGGNPDLYKYRGYGLLAINYRSLNDKFRLSLILNPRQKWGNCNMQLELNLKLNPNANQYLFIQWYNGYGESLLDYNRYSSMLRMGICIKPPLRNLY
jgi:phospholipase A1